MGLVGEGGEDEGREGASVYLINEGAIAWHVHPDGDCEGR